MKKLFLFLFLAFMVSGCASKSMLFDRMKTTDVVLQEYPTDTEILAENVVSTLSRYYSPAKTEIWLMKIKGSFGDALQAQFRSAGFAVNELDGKTKKLPKNGIGIAYILDMLQDADRPTVFANIQLTDGQRFTLVRRVRITEVPKIQEIKTDSVPLEQ